MCPVLFLIFKGLNSVVTEGRQNPLIACLVRQLADHAECPSKRGKILLQSLQVRHCCTNVTLGHRCILPSSQVQPSGAFCWVASFRILRLICHPIGFKLVWWCLIGTQITRQNKSWYDPVCVKCLAFLPCIVSLDVHFCALSNVTFGWAVAFLFSLFISSLLLQVFGWSSGMKGVEHLLQAMHWKTSL